MNCTAALSSDNRTLFDNCTEDGDVVVSVDQTSDEASMSTVNLLWSVGFTVIVVVGTCGNGIVLWIIVGG